ncbi:hypothetical protein, partial [Marinitoga sp. 1197]|uniref:hypothetical protein n=1 Tax=Marinitoga sp. 1197 TaxID=1428449 RepID=UPI00064122AF
MKKIVILVWILFIIIISFSKNYTPWKPNNPPSECQTEFLNFYNEIYQIYEDAVKWKAASPDLLEDLKIILEKYKPDLEYELILNENFENTNLGKIPEEFHVR